VSKVLEPEAFRDGNVVEGYMDVGSDGKRMIALASDIYDPAMSKEELTSRVGEVLNHEIIHAMRSLGMFTEKEMKALARAANSRKFVNRNGQKRAYTYLDRAVQMNALLPQDQRISEDAVIEEAIAEMFRDSAAGRINMGGKPRGLLDRIMNAIKAIATAGRSMNINKAGDLFARISSGEIASRSNTNRSALNGRPNQRSRSIRTGRRKVGSLAPLEGAPTVRGATGPDANLVIAAEKYAKQRGIAFQRQGEYATVDEAFATRISDAYEAMEHAPENAKVRRAYADMTRQVKDQYRSLGS
jgi:hypothetical protein